MPTTDSSSDGHRGRGVLLVLVGLMCLGMSIVPAAMGAAPVVDTETTDTSTTSDITGSTTVDPFEANSSKTSAFEFEVDSTNPEVWLIDDATGETVRVYGASAFNQTYANDTEDSYYYRKTFSHDEFATISGVTGENSSVTLRIYNNSSVDNPDTTNVTFELAQSERTVVRAGQSALDNGDADLVQYSPIGTDALDVLTRDATEIETTTSIPGNGTVTVVGANSTVADRLSTSAEGASSGDWIGTTILNVNGEYVRVFQSEVPDGWDTSDTYAVYDSGDGTVTAYIGDDIEASSDATVALDANKGRLALIRSYGLTAYTASLIGFDTTGLDTVLTSLSFGLVGLSLVGIGRRDLTGGGR